jgi:hypothetical protein
MDELLRNNFYESFVSMNGGQRRRMVLDLTIQLPAMLENHVLTLRDSAIQNFHDEKFFRGWIFAIRALFKAPFNSAFIRNLLYHFNHQIKIMFKAI